MQHPCATGIINLHHFSAALVLRAQHQTCQKEIARRNPYFRAEGKNRLAIPSVFDIGAILNRVAAIVSGCRFSPEPVFLDTAETALKCRHNHHQLQDQNRLRNDYGHNPIGADVRPGLLEGRPTSIWHSKVKKNNDPWIENKLFNFRISVRNFKSTSPGSMK